MSKLITVKVGNSIWTVPGDWDDKTIPNNQTIPLMPISGEYRRVTDSKGGDDE